jgi:DNA adenine methylase
MALRNPEGPAPFLKWAGGKSQLLSYLDRYFPQRFDKYFEPFLGGGAVFFHLVRQGRIERAVISDLNKDLINCYVAIRDSLEELLENLKQLQRHARDKDFYYNNGRKRFNEIQLSTGIDGNVEKAALMMYLNKTCYNGLYRVNKKDEFNVPWGRYRNPRICDEQNLRAVNAVLRREGVEILCKDYQEVVEDSRAGDFIYFDPPYQPVSSTADFTAYTKQSFTIQDQQRLAEVFRELNNRGCLLMLSNSPKARDLYRGYQVVNLKATRAISCVGSGRGSVDELLIMNYHQDRFGTLS